MAIENVKAFYEALETDTELQAKINAADAAYTGDVDDKVAAAAAIILPIAKEAGFDFTAEELNAYESKAASSDEEFEFSEDELEAVAGGYAICFFIGFGKSKNKNSGALCKHIGFGFGDGE